MTGRAAALTVALPKGRLLRPLTALFARAGYSAEALARDDRSLVRTSDDGSLRFLLLKPDDVPTYVDHGAADVGVCGRDVLRERPHDLYEPLDLGLGRCRLVLAGPIGGPPAPPVPRVATKYARLAREHFARRGQPAEIIAVGGSVELAPLVGLADLIVDLVETGATLEQNGLAVLEEITTVTSVVVANRAAFKLKHDATSDLLARLREALPSPSPSLAASRPPPARATLEPMAGCGGGTCGINKGREKEKASALKALRHALGGGHAPPVGLPFDELARLGAHLEEVLPVRAFVRPGAEPGACDWLYLLAGLHPASLYELAEGTCEPAERTRDDETYVRLGFSPLGPFVTLQEVVMRVEPGEPPLLFEEPKVGIEDRRLQLIVKGLQGALRKRRLVVLDAAFLVGAPPADLAQGPGGAPSTLWAGLFDLDPPETSRLIALPAA
ncbi:MAG: ATP phosphoribosyltransferase [Polyangiaceae bacterium]|jgi:ATP phosphoribosyltransferase|nr:ATP phosphoribosyltransferase [Polyangiaceae bacterium]